MNVVTRTVAAAAAVAAAAVGFASPASADELNGSYSLFSDQSQRTLNGIPIPYKNSSSIWNITPCGDGCAHIVSAAGWNADASLNNGRWEFARDAVWGCPDGTYLPQTISYSIDAATLTGVSTGTIPVGCEGFPIFADGVKVALTRA